MSLPEGADDPGVDRDRLMKTACLVYLAKAEKNLMQAVTLGAIVIE